MSIFPNKSYFLIYLRALLLIGLGISLFCFSWICDDAFISFRVLDNFHTGYGLRFNILERVEVFTHPLWLLFLMCLSKISGEYYFTSLLSSLIICAFTIYLLAFRLARGVQNSLVILIFLLFSFAFLEFSSSGLENPLSHLLIVSFYLVLNSQSKQRLFWLSFCSALLWLCRLDYILLTGPCLAFQLLTQRKNRLRVVIAGMLPLLAWKIFALIYYGFLFPNTAYAKLGSDIPQFEILTRGMQYLANAFLYDPVTLCVCMVTPVLTLIHGNSLLRQIACGIVLYLIYIIWIGGDFMSGRFLSAPFVMSLCILSGLSLRRHIVLPGILTLLIPALILYPARSKYPDVQHSTLLSAQPDLNGWQHGIFNERFFYAATSALLKNIQSPELFKTDEFYQLGVELRHSNTPAVISGSLGFLGFAAGPQVHIVDMHALADPFLARLPVDSSLPWRPGHLPRKVPENYLSAVFDWQTLIDPEERNLLRAIQLVSRAELFSSERWREILRLQTGYYSRQKP